MSDCVNKKSCIDYARLGENAECYLCPDYKAPMTNADRIRAMSDEELAYFISDIADTCERNTECNQHCCGCVESYCEYARCLDWLQQPAEEVNEEND